VAQEDQEQPDVLFVYARKGDQMHLEQRNLQPSELGLLVLSWWLQLNPPDRADFIELLGRYEQGLAEPPPVAVGMAAIVRRGSISPGSSNGNAE
jgi:hypothetical protein